MSKKLLAVLTPVLATVAFAVAPTEAQVAAPSWYRNGAQIPESAGEVPTVSWGDLSLKGAVEINCHNDGGGTVENRTVGGVLKGFDKIYDFSAFLCVSPNIVCPAGFRVAVEARNLPWLTELMLVGGTIRDNVTGVKVKSGCQRNLPGNAAGENEVIGTNFVLGPGQKEDPLAPFGTRKGGTSALNPAKYSYDAGSGELEEEGSGGAIKVVIEGELKVLGFSQQELIQVKNP